MRIKFGDFTFDSGTRQLSRRGTMLSLTPKALSILDALIDAAPNPMTKEQLYERLWPGVFVETGNLHNLVSELRTAMSDSGREIIRTVHRVGYMFAAPLVREASTSPRLEIGDDVLTLAEGETIIGRELLGTPDVSRQHARIVVSPSQITIEDLGSKNGTFVGGQRLRKRVTVQDGAEIVFGRTRATLRVIDAAAATVTSPPLT